MSPGKARREDPKGNSTRGGIGLTWGIVTRGVIKGTGMVWNENIIRIRSTTFKVFPRLNRDVRFVKCSGALQVCLTSERGEGKTPHTNLPLLLLHQ